MVAVTSASRNQSSTSSRGLIPWNCMELAEAVPIEKMKDMHKKQRILPCSVIQPSHQKGQTICTRRYNITKIPIQNSGRSKSPYTGVLDRSVDTDTQYITKANSSNQFTCIYKQETKFTYTASLGSLFYGLRKDLFFSFV